MRVRTVVLLDFDNLYFALEKEDARVARTFMYSPRDWVEAIRNGRLLPLPDGSDGRAVLSLRCYANPDLLQRFGCRLHFVRAGFAVIDCPSLTQSGKNSADIHMVLDAVDLLQHETRFDEFLILSADADFTPLLQRLRLHDRSSAVFVNHNTAPAYKAVASQQISMEAMVAQLRLGDVAEPKPAEKAAPKKARKQDAAAKADPVDLTAQQSISMANQMHRLPEDIRDLGMKLRGVIDCPVVPGEAFGDIFAVLSLLLAEKPEFDLSTITKDARDRFRDRDLPIARPVISFVMRGIMVSGLALTGRPAPAELAAAYAASLEQSCATAGLALSEGERALLHRWIGVAPPEAPAEGATPSQDAG